MNNQPKNQQGIDMDQSQGMDEAEREIFLNVRRSRSDESFLGKLTNFQDLNQKRQLIIDLNENQGTNNLTGFRVFKKQKKEKKKIQSHYRKNICGYITKKVLREFVSPNYTLDVQDRCLKHKVPYQAVKSFYISKIEQVTGPSHIPGLLIAQNQSQTQIKKVFKEFFDWFLKQRYLRYLLIEGKMADKKAYIEYKNYLLLGMLSQNDKDLLQMKEEDEEDQEEQDQEEKLSSSHNKTPNQKEKPNNKN